MPSPAPLRPVSGSPWSLGELVRLLDAQGGVILAGTAGSTDSSAVRVTGITHDSRAVRPGDVYAGLPGARAHGADFTAEAVAAGAVALFTDPDGAGRARGVGLPVLVVDDPRGRLGVLAAWVYREPSADLLLIGVTGTNGKTTTAYLLRSGLTAAGHRPGLIGTVETWVGDEVASSVRTTPEAPDLQALFAVMRERGVTAVAMEVSSHALALGRVDGTVFDVAVFTNLTQDHLDFHGDLERYFAAKAALFTPRRTRAAVINIDDQHGRRLAAELTARGELPVSTFSPSGAVGAHWRAVDLECGPWGSQLRVVGPDGTDRHLSVPLPGEFNVENALAAMAALVVAGVPAERAAAGVMALSGVPGRMERISAGQPFLAVVDFAHTPAAVRTLLSAVREVTAGRVMIVVGCGGDRDRAKRPLIGQAAAELADLAVFTDDNPRSENPVEILAAVHAGAQTVPGSGRAEVVVEPDRAAAIARAVAAAGPGDAVVVAGKGHEQGQEVGGVVRPFDDRAVLRSVLGRYWPAAGGRVGHPRARENRATDRGDRATDRGDQTEDNTGESTQ